jgi:hypothetical protein
MCVFPALSDNPLGYNIIGPLSLGHGQFTLPFGR